MNLKKIVGSTVDRLTLSYTEKHLKEALEQEHVIPSPILAVIADKSFNDYNMKSISSFLDKSFKLDQKDWRKFRNLLKIIEYLLKFGSNEFVALARQHSSNIRSLQNYSFSEGGSDKGAGIRESALMILQLLNNPRDLDYIREESKRRRDRFTGISSNPTETSGGYANNGYSYNAPSYQDKKKYESQSFDYRDGRNEGLIFNESQKKFAESVFGVQGEYRGPEMKSELFGVKKEDGRENQRGDIFQQNSRNPDIFAVKSNFNNSEIFASEGSKSSELRFETPHRDLFNTEQSSFGKSSMVKASGDLFSANGSLKDSRLGSNTSKTVDLFAGVNRKDSKPRNEDTSYVSGTSQVSGPGYNLFEVTQKAGKVDLFEVSAKPVDLFEVSSKPVDLFEVSSKPFEVPSKPFETQSKPFETPSKPFETPSKPFETPSKPFETQSKPFETHSKPFETHSKPPQVDLFAIRPTQATLFEAPKPFESQPIEKSTKTPDLFANTSLKVNQSSHPQQVSRNPQPDLFGLEPSKLNDSSIVLQSGGNVSSQKNLFGDLQMGGSSMFTGMVQKRAPETSAAQNFPSFGLDGLDLSSTSISSNPPPQNIPIKSATRVKSNLIQSESKPESIKKVFNPSEFEEKLFSLDFN